MTKDEALKQALEALENISTALREDDVLGSDTELMLNAITAINEALDECDEDELIIQYHEATIKRLENRIDELMAQPAQEHDPWRMAQPKEHHALQVAAGSQAFYGFPTEPASASNAGGKCVTAGETAPTHTINAHLSNSVSKCLGISRITGCIGFDQCCAEFFDSCHNYLYLLRSASMLAAPAAAGTLACAR